MAQTVTPYLLYSGCEDALDFLSRAFGFEETLRYIGAEGYVNHAEMAVGDGHIYMGNPGPQYRNPRQLGQETVGIYVEIHEDVDAHYERAKTAGAEILEEPADQPYGHRRYTARDPEGHQWYFAQVVEQVAPEEWGATVA
jgi:PhnB protein